MSSEQRAFVRRSRQAVRAGMLPQEVAGHVFQAIRAEKLYILTHPEWNSEVQKRMDPYLTAREPRLKIRFRRPKGHSRYHSHWLARCSRARLAGASVFGGLRPGDSLEVQA